MVTWLGVLVLSFALGSTPWGWILARQRGVNLRKVGSGNIGATNVARALGLGWGVLVFFLDAAKGLVPVALTRYFFPQHADLWAWAGCAAVFGHVFSPFLKFRGGKGVATAFGAFLAIEPWAALMALGAFMVTLGLSSYVALGSMMGVMVFWIALYVLFTPASGILVAAGVVAVLILVRHSDNVRRMFRKQEHRVNW